MIYAIFMSALVAFFFSMGMMFKKKDWSYGDSTYKAKETRSIGWTAFIVIFIICMVMWGSGGY